MSYSKIQVRYYGDGISLTGVQAREGMLKKVTLTLPKRVIEYGDEHGYYSIRVDYDCDHLILKAADGKVLLDKDINAGSKEYIRQIVDYDWM